MSSFKGLTTLGFRTLVKQEPQAFLELFHRVYPFLRHHRLGQISIGFIVGCSLRGSYFWIRPPTSTVTIREGDEPFPIMMASLEKLQQPRSVILAADNTSEWRLDSDSDSESDSDPKCSNRDDKSVIVKYEPNIGIHLYWYNRRPLWVRRGRDGPVEYLSFTVCSPSGSPKALVEFVSRCLQEQRGYELSVTVVREADSKSYRPWHFKTLKPSRPLETVILPKATKDDIIQDLEMFIRLATRRWYRKRGYHYRRGHLYYGPLGTGKSSLAGALASYLHYELYVVPNSLDQETLTKLLRRAHVPSTVLLEDVDALNTTTAKRRIPETSKSGLTSLSTLLNALDGVAAKEGTILIMTKKHLEGLDPALVRPGRIDKMVCFINTTQSELNDLFLITYLSDASERLHKTNKKIPTHAADNEGIPTLAANSEEIPTLTAYNEKIHKLAERFNTTIPSNVFTVAEVQGYLLPLREDPHGAIAGAAAWSEQKIKEGLSPAAKGKDQKPNQKEDVPEIESDDEGVSSTGDITG